MGIRVAVMTTHSTACLRFPRYRSSERNILPADAYLVLGPGNYGNLVCDYVANLFTRYTKTDKRERE